MLRRTLLLAAFAAFTSALPSPEPPQCTVITDELQKAWKTLDPHMFPRIPDFKYIHDDASFPFDFKNVISDGFSNVTCEYSTNFGSQMVLLTLNGSKVDFSKDHPKAQGLLKERYFSSKSASFLQVYEYAIALSLHYDNSPPNPLSLCITNVSLEITPNAEHIVANYPIDVKLWLKLKRHTQELAKTAKDYFPSFAKGLTRQLNEVLCKPQNIFPSPTTRTTSLTSSTETHEQLLGSGCCGIPHSRFKFDCCRSQRNIGHHLAVPGGNCCQNFSRRPFVAV